MKSLLAALAAVALLAPAARAQDAFQWLEDIDSPRAMAWVEKQNARTAARLEDDPRYPVFLAEAKAIFTAEDRIPTPHFRAGGIDNLWQDAAHPHGLWRHAAVASYRTTAPDWRTTLDLDALAKAEGKNWIWKGATCLKPAETTCLVRLSNGGGDAVEVREYDTVAGRFVEGGFHFQEGKQSVEWLSHDELVVGREWVPGEVTRSGYAYVLKTVARNGAQREIFRGQKSDVSAGPIVLRGEGGRTDGLIVRRGVTFFESEYTLLGDRGPVRIPLPLKAEYQDYVGGQAVFTIQDAWGGFAPGALIAYDLAELKARGAEAKARLVFQPGPRQAIQQVAATGHRLVVVLLEDVKGAVDAYDVAGGQWTRIRLPLPADANITLVDTAAKDDRLFVTVEGFLEPTSLWLADAAAGTADKVKALPPVSTPRPTSSSSSGPRPPTGPRSPTSWSGRRPRLWTARRRR